MIVKSLVPLVQSVIPLVLPPSTNHGIVSLFPYLDQNKQILFEYTQGMSVYSTLAGFRKGKEKWEIKKLFYIRSRIVRHVKS